MIIPVSRVSLLLAADVSVGFAEILRVAVR